MKECTACRQQTNKHVGMDGAAVLYRLARKTRLAGQMLFAMCNGKTFRQTRTKTSHQSPTIVIQGVNATVRFDKQQLWLDSVDKKTAEFLYVEVMNSKPEGAAS